MIGKMKKLYMILAAIAAMTFTAQANDVCTGVVEIGDFDNATEFYNGSYFDMAPTNFYLAHTGAQMIYTADDLGNLEHDVCITTLSFKFMNNDSYEDITRDVKLYLQETDANQFEVVEGVKQFFPFDNLVLEEEQVYEMLNFLYEDHELVLDLSDAPFALTKGKGLLVTVVFDAQDDENCTWGSDYAPFYTSGVRGQAMVYTDNWTSFLDYEEFPDASAIYGCGTNVELPVTRINYFYEDIPSAVEEIELGCRGD